MANEERANCTHHEKIEEYHEYALGTCMYCGQVRRYDRLDIRVPPRIVEIGRINGVEVNGIPNRIKESVAVEEKKSDKPEKPAVAREEVVIRDRKWYQAHKKEMIEDLITMGYDAFMEKWKVKWQIVSHLKSDELYKSRVGLGELSVKKEKDPKSSKAKSPKSPKSPPEPLGELPFKIKVISAEDKLISLGTFTVEAASELPAFPSFNDSWPFPVQEKWLEVYLQIRKLELEKKQ